MKKKKVLRRKNIHSIGGALEVAGTAATQVAGAIGQSKGVDDKATSIKNDIVGNITNPAPPSSTEDLLSKWSTWSPMQNITYKDLYDKGTMGIITDGLTNGIQGAMSGSKLGPVGAIAGGVGGLATGIFGGLSAKHRAKKQAKNLNRIIDAANLNTLDAFSNQANQLDEEMIARDLSDFTGWAAAYGGPLFAEGGTLDKEEINPGLDAMVKARLALDSHFGNPTARRMTNYDTRSYTFPDGRRGNVYVGSYGNYVTPQIQDVNGELKFIEDPLSDENRERSKAQSMKFENPRDAEYFAKNYKRFAPMMSLYSKGGMIQNAKKWHHAFGGDLMTHGANFDTGVTLVGNGGTHEENPNEGVPMGVDEEGIPNLVEEGEVIFNDYVFSKRLQVPKAVKKKYKLRGTKSLTFADAAIQLSKESEERPNDPISQAGLDVNMNRLMMAQEDIRQRRQSASRRFSHGGKLGRVYSGDDTEYPQILKLDRENPLLVPTTLATKESAPSSLIDTSKSIVNERWRDSALNPNRDTGMDYLRFAPAAQQGIQALTDALGFTNRPEYTLGRRMREANAQVRGISTRAAGQRMGYKPVDEWSAINNLNAQMAAQRSAIRNAGNRVAAPGLSLAQAYSQNMALGNLYANMEDKNWQRLSQAISHNTSVDQANRAAELQAAQFSAQQGNIRAQNLINAARADDAEETAYAQARAANRDNFYNTLGTIGKERIDRAMMSGLISSGVFGTANNAMLQALGYLGVNPVRAAEGGKLSKKKRKGLTY